MLDKQKVYMDYFGKRKRRWFLSCSHLFPIALLHLRLMSSHPPAAAPGRGRLRCGSQTAVSRSTEQKGGNRLQVSASPVLFPLRIQKSDDFVARTRPIFMPGPNKQRTLFTKQK